MSQFSVLPSLPPTVSDDALSPGSSDENNDALEKALSLVAWYLTLPRDLWALTRTCSALHCLWSDTILLSAWLMAQHRPCALSKALGHPSPAMRAPLVQRLLSQGADVDSAEKFGCGPLHIALAAGFDEVVQALLVYKADPRAPDAAGVAHYHAAKLLGVELLHRTPGTKVCTAPWNPAAGTWVADWGTRDDPWASRVTPEDTPLEIACKRGNVGMVKALLAAGAPPLEGDGRHPEDEISYIYRPRPPLNSSCRAGNVSVVVALLAAGAPMDSKGDADDEHRSPLHEAVQEGHEGVLKVLLQAICRPKAPQQQAQEAASGGTQAHQQQAQEAASGSGTLEQEPQALNQRGAQGSPDQAATSASAAANTPSAPISPRSPADRPSPTALLDAQDRNGQTPLHLACALGDARAAAMLLSAGATPNLSHLAGLTPLCVAVRQGHIPVMRAFRKAAAAAGRAGSNLTLNPEVYWDPDQSDPYGKTLLHEAAEKGQAQVVEYLLEAWAEVDAADGYYKRTALHWAAEEGHVDVIRVLLAAGANIEALDTEGRTPLMAACGKTHLMTGEAVRVLLAAGANVWATDQEQHIALHYACRVRGMADTVLVPLIAAGVDVNAQSSGGLTPMLVACSTGDVGAAEALLAAGANASAADFQGRTPLHLAGECAWGAEEIVPLLVQAGGDLGAEDRQGATPLHEACACDMPKQGAVVAAMLALGAPRAAVNRAGETPLEVAQRHGARAEVLELLKGHTKPHSRAGNRRN